MMTHPNDVMVIVVIFVIIFYQKVIEVSKQYLPYMAEGFKSPKLTVHVEDGAKFMEKHQGQFDVIITDSSDPIGKN